MEFTIAGAMNTNC